MHPKTTGISKSHLKVPGLPEYHFLVPDKNSTWARCSWKSGYRKRYSISNRNGFKGNQHY